MSSADETTKDNDGVIELPDDEEDETEALKKIQDNDKRKEDIKRIRAKALMRRARARSEQGGWGNLQGALEGTILLRTLSCPFRPCIFSLSTNNPFPQPDYQTLSSFLSLPLADTKTIDAALRTLPPRVAAAQKAEMGEMMGKLKELGNGILKPFGLSTDSFKFEKDEKTGGYSIGMKN